LDFWKVEFFTAGREDICQRANMRHRAKFRGDWSEGSRGTKMCHNAKFRGDRSNRCCDMAIFRFVKMAEAAVLDFENVEILRAGKLKTAKVRHRAKFRVNRTNPC